MAPSCPPVTEVVPAGSFFFQSFRLKVRVNGREINGSPLYMDPSDRGRFNASDQSFGTTYLAKSPEGAFLETFVRNPEARAFSKADVQARQLACIRTIKPLTLAKCYGDGLNRNGDYHQSQAASGLWYHDSDIDGAIYLSRFNNELLCIALYDRAAGKVEVRYKEAWYDFPGFPDILRMYDLAELD